MRTTLNLDEELLKKAQEATQIREKTALIHEALRQVIQRAASLRLSKLGGKLPNLKAPPRRRS